MRIALMASAQSLHTRRWAAWLVARGHTVALFSDTPLPDDPAMAGVARYPPRWTLWRKFVTFKLRGGRYANSRDKWRAYRDDLVSFRPDVLHAMEAVNYGPSLLRFPQFPRVLTPWGRDIESLAWLDIDPERKRLVLEGCAGADVVATNAPGLESHWASLMQLQPERLRFFPWGIERSIFRPRPIEEQQGLRQRLGISPQATIVASPRRADPYYGVGEMLAAWSTAPPKADAELVLLRGGVGDEHWTTLRASAAGVPGVRLVDQLLTPGEMAALLSTSAFCVFAPRTDLLACTLLESMACGSIPLVVPNPAYRAAVTSIGAESWPADRGVGIVAAGHSAADLRAALGRAWELAPDTRAAAARHNATAMAEHFAWEHHASGMEAAYAAAIARAGSGVMGRW